MGQPGWAPERLRLRLGPLVLRLRLGLKAGPGGDGKTKAICGNLQQFISMCSRLQLKRGLFSYFLLFFKLNLRHLILILIDFN